MRFAYADPPYMGCCARYGHRHEAPYGCWDDLETHRLLFRNLRDQYPDGWALSCGSNNQEDMLHLCRLVFGRNRVRNGGWLKPFASYKPNVNPAYTWEPVIFKGGRKRDRRKPTCPDWHVENITLRKGLTGAKPRNFPDWILALLGVDFASGDTIDDLFPGTNGVTLTFKERREPTHGVFS